MNLVLNPLIEPGWLNAILPPNTFLKRMSPSVQELISQVKHDHGGKTMVAGRAENRISNFEVRISEFEVPRTATHTMSSKSEIRNPKSEIQLPASPRSTGGPR